MLLSASSRPPQVTLGTLPSGDAGTKATLNLMAALVRRYKKHYPIRALALSLVAPLIPKDWHGEVARLHGFVRDRIRYVKDIYGVETLATPERTLEIGQGDCDDKSLLLATLLESIGHPTRLVAVAVRPRRQFCHVYVETKVGPGWIPLEATEPWPAGMAVPNATRRLVVHTGSHNALNGNRRILR